jgi:hypothetical protein
VVKKKWFVDLGILEIGGAMTGRTSSSRRPISRFGFVLRVLTATAAGYILELLFHGHSVLGPLVPAYLRAIEGVVIFGSVGIYLMSAIDGRLLDAGLARWYRNPAFLVWLLSTTLPGLLPRTWPLDLALFALFLLTGGLIPGKSFLADAAAREKVRRHEGIVQPTRGALPPLPRVSPTSFLNSLLTIGCLGLPLILLQTASGHEAGMWAACLGGIILAVTWCVKLLGRLEDAGYPLHLGHAGFVVFGALCIGILRRISDTLWVHSLSSHDVFRIVSNLLIWLRPLNGYEMLALFLVIQVPLALLPSSPLSDEAITPRRPPNKFEKQLAAREKKVRPYLIGPSTFLLILLVIAALWAPLIYLDSASAGGVGTWVARSFYAILTLAWIIYSEARLEDAGWTKPADYWQYRLVVAVVSLMPLGVHWVNSYGALAIFLIIQIPSVFLKSRPISGEPNAGKTDLNESRADVPSS